VGAALGLFLGLTKWRGLALLLASLVAVNLLAIFMAGNVPPGAVVLGLATALGAGALYHAFCPRPQAAEDLPEPPTSRAATASRRRGDNARDRG
jgi:4-hydroxybenzoate polyprenyltransferase